MSIQHKGTKSIETIRLKLRRFDAQDSEDMFYNWAGDPEVCKYLSWGPHKDVDTCLKRVLNWVSNYNYEDSYVWAIELKSTKRVIGSISVEISDNITQSCEVGYCIGKPYWSRGIVTEALRAVMHYLFYEVGFQSIRAKHDTQNIASGKVMIKAGMHFTRIESRVGVRRDGSYYDCAVYTKYKTDD
jgi:ribosomal-protein-alanine N-acetyltransferase